MRFVVLETPWWQCIAAGVPFLMTPGDSFTVIRPGLYQPTDETDVIMNPHRSPQLAPIWNQNPDRVVLYETENVIGSDWRAQSVDIRRTAPRCEWWNYSFENSAVFGDTPKPLRFSRGRRKLRPTSATERDVFFVGSLNERRGKVLDDLRRAGLRVCHPANSRPLFGAPLAIAESQARVVLNMHFYQPGVFESFRVVPAYARGCDVISETSLGNEGTEFCAAVVPYSDLVATVLDFVKGDPSCPNSDQSQPKNAPQSSSRAGTRVCAGSSRNTTSSAAPTKRCST